MRKRAAPALAQVESLEKKFRARDVGAALTNLAQAIVPQGPPRAALPPAPTWICQPVLSIPKHRERSCAVEAQCRLDGVCADRRRRRVLKCPNCATQQFSFGEPTPDGRATMMGKRLKAVQQAIDANQRSALNKPNRVDRLGKQGVHQYRSPHRGRKAIFRFTATERVKRQARDSSNAGSRRISSCKRRVYATVPSAPTNSA
jgi:hypothetical protein